MLCHCGTEFEPKRATQKHCSDKCRLEAFQSKRREQLRAAIIERHLYHMRSELAAAKLEPFTNADLD